MEIGISVIPLQNYHLLVRLTWLFGSIQVTGIPVIFISALEGRGRLAVMRQVIETYEKWCSRLSTARLNRWLRKVSRKYSFVFFSAYL